MKKGVLPFILAGAGLLMSLSAGAKDVYVYSTSGDALGQLAKVKRIELNNDKLTLVPTKGDNVNVDMDKFGFLTFRSLDPGAVSTVGTDNLKVKIEGDVLFIESPSEITSVSVYNTLGELKGHAVPNATTASMTIASNGLNIIVVEAGGIKST